MTEDNHKGFLKRGIFSIDENGLNIHLGFLKNVKFWEKIDFLASIHMEQNLPLGIGGAFFFAVFGLMGISLVLYGQGQILFTKTSMGIQNLSLWHQFLNIWCWSISPALGRIGLGAVIGIGMYIFGRGRKPIFGCIAASITYVCVSMWAYYLTLNHVDDLAILFLDIKENLPAALIFSFDSFIFCFGLGLALYCSSQVSLKISSSSGLENTLQSRLFLGALVAMVFISPVVPAGVHFLLTGYLVNNRGVDLLLQSSLESSMVLKTAAVYFLCTVFLQIAEIVCGFLIGVSTGLYGRAKGRVNVFWPKALTLFSLILFPVYSRLMLIHYYAEELMEMFDQSSGNVITHSIASGLTQSPVIFALSLLVPVYVTWYCSFSLDGEDRSLHNTSRTRQQSEE